MRIGAKFTSFSFLLVIISIVGVSVLFYISEKKLLTDGISEKEIELARTFVQISEDALRVNDELPVLNYVTTIKKTNGVVYALLADKNNIIVAHTDSKHIGEKSGDTVGLKAYASNGLLKQAYPDKSGKEIIEISLPVMAGKVKKGVVRIGFSKSVMNEIITTALNRTRSRIAYIAAIILIIGLIGAVIMSGRMTGPIKKLSEGAVSIGEGNLDYQIKINSNDEIGELSRNFNLMTQKLKELDQMKKDFVSSVSHELRSPLTAIEGYIDYFFDIPPDKVDREKWRKALDIMRKNTSRLNNFISDILDLAKIEAAQFEINKKSLNIFPVAEEIVALFEPLAREKQITVNLKIPFNLPDVLIDADKIKQVFTNLISNALKFTPDKGEIKITGKALGNGFVQVSVLDTGIGISGDALAHIFDRFWKAQVISDRIKKAKGTGLGLSIAKGIVELHGGKIWVESEFNKGTAFCFTLQKN